MSENTSSRILGLDGLRALAIAGIVLYHLIPLDVPGGFLGVTSFFTIMGYLMVVTTKKKLEYNTFTPVNYYKGKIRRLYPPLLITLLFGIIFLMILQPHYKKGTFTEVISIIFGYNNWHQILANGSYFTRISNASPFTHLWYMGLTIQYYAIWPLFILLMLYLQKKLIAKNREHVLRHKRLITITILSVACILSALEMFLLYNPDVDPSRIYYGTDTRAYSLILGMIIALIPLDRGKEWASKGKNYIVVIALAILVTLGMIVMYATVEGTSALNYQGLMQSFNLLSGLQLILVLISQDRLGRALEWAPLRWTGKLSYIIYLVMYPIIFFIQSITKNNGVWIWRFLTLVAILAASLLIYTADQQISKRRYTVIPIPKETDEPTLWSLEYHSPQAKSFTLQWKIRQFTLVLLIATVLVSLGQTAYAKKEQGLSDQKKMEAQLKQSHERLKEQQAAAAAQQTVEPLQASDVTAIGDSVMLGAAEEMLASMPGLYVDAVESRQTRDAVTFATDLNNAGFLRNTVVIHLGTNGSFKPETGQALIDYLGPDRRIYWVNAYGTTLTWQGEVNTVIQQLADANSNLTVLDWAGYAAPHPEWFYNDGIHLNGEGRKAYAQFIKDGLAL